MACQRCKNLRDKVIHGWETLKLCQRGRQDEALSAGDMMREWAAAKEGKQVAVITLGPTCRCRGAPVSLEENTAIQAGQ